MSSHDFRVNHKCPICSKLERDSLKTKQRGIKKTKRTKFDFIKECIDNNPNFIIENTDSIINGESFATVRCKFCNRESTQKVKYIIKGCSCMKCSRKISFEEFEKRTKDMYPKYYKINSQNFNNDIIEIECAKCGKKRRRSIYDACSGKSICHCINEEKFINRIKLLYDGDYEYKSGYKTMKSNVIMIHKKCNKEIQIRASHFLYDGCTCSRCNPYRNEEKIKIFLESKNIEYISQKTFDGCKHKQKLQFDIFVPAWNLLIEYDGEGHFRPIFTSEDEFKIAKFRDMRKDDFAKENKINILRIPYWRRDDIDVILEDVKNIFDVNSKSYSEIQLLLNLYKDHKEFGVSDSYDIDFNI